MFALATVSPPEPERRIKRFPLGAGSAVSHFHSQAKRKRVRDGWGGGRRERERVERDGKPEGGLKTLRIGCISLC